MLESKIQNVWAECEENHSRIISIATLTALGVILLLGIANGLLTNLGWFYSFLIAPYAVLVPFAGYQVIQCLSDLQQPRGRLLGDFGGMAGRVAMLVFLSVLFVANLGLLFDTLTAGKAELKRVLPSLSGLLVCGILYMNFAGRLQFWSGGLLGYRRFLKWEDLEFFEWKSAGDWKKSALWLKYQHPQFGPVKHVYIFPDEDKEQVEELLRQHIRSVAEETKENAEAELQSHPA